jgi:hypothetical protein
VTSIAGMLGPDCRGSPTVKPSLGGGRYEERIGETKNAFIFGIRPTRGKPVFSPRDPAAGNPAVVLPGEDVAPLPQHLRWIDAVFASEELSEPG